MQHSKLCLTVASLIAATVVQGRAQSFEGVTQFVNYQSTNSDRPDTLTQYVKGLKTRIDGIGNGTGGMIVTADKMYMLDTPHRQYVEAPLEAKDFEAMGTAKGSAAKTGKTETVAGVTCDDWHYKSDDDGKMEEGEACLAKGGGLMLASLSRSGMKMLSAGGKAFSDALAAGSGIMKVTSNGKVTLLVLRTQASPVPDAMFAPPTGYKKIGG